MSTRIGAKRQRPQSSADTSPCHGRCSVYLLLTLILRNGAEGFENPWGLLRSSTASPQRRYHRRRGFQHHYHHRHRHYGHHQRLFVTIQTRNNPLFVENDTQYSQNNNIDHHNNNNNIEDETRQYYNFWEEPAITTATFNMDLQNIAEVDAQKAQDALEVMEELYHKQNNNNNNNKTSMLYVKPNVACYTTVMDGWLQRSSIDPSSAASKAQALLDRMERMYDETGDESIRPNTVSYMIVCQCWGDSYLNDELTGESAEKAEAILERMQRRGLFPNAKLYTLVLTAWCKRAGRVRGAMERAERILTQMEELSEHEASDPERNVRPNIITYTSVIAGLAKCKERDLAARAEAILDRMEANGVDADMVAYTSVINAWSRAKGRRERKIAAKRAMALLSKMEKLYAEDDQYHLKPNLITYSTAINAIGNSLDPKGPDMAEKLLRHMYDLHDSGTITGIRPTTATFNAVITALARCKARRGPQNAYRAEKLLTEMMKRAKEETTVEPNIRTYGGVILAWAESGVPDAAEKAQSVLDRMQKMVETGESTVSPNVVCYTNVIGAWTRSRRPDAFEKAETLLKHMEEQFEATGDTEVRPNTISYVQFIDGLIRRNVPDAALWAQRTVDRMMRLYAKGLGHARPSRIVFNSLIHAYSRSDEPNAAQIAEQILQWMESQYRNHGDEYVKPDEITFCGVLNAWANHAKDGGAHRAQQILDHMESLTSQQRGFHSTVISYNIVIKAWARSLEPDAIERSEHILHRLQERRDPRPDTTTYSSVINCCAYYTGPPEGKRKAFDVAMRTFQKLSDSTEDETNHVAYGTLLKAVMKLVESIDERDKIIRDVFSQACRDGQVEAFVLSQTRNGSSPEVFRELVLKPAGLGRAKKGRSIHALLQKIPPKWARNVIC